MTVSALEVERVAVELPDCDRCELAERRFDAALRTVYELSMRMEDVALRRVVVAHIAWLWATHGHSKDAEGFHRFFVRYMSDVELDMDPGLTREDPLGERWRVWRNHAAILLGREPLVEPLDPTPIVAWVVAKPPQSAART